MNNQSEMNLFPVSEDRRVIRRNQTEFEQVAGAWHVSQINVVFGIISKRIVGCTSEKPIR